MVNDAPVIKDNIMGMMSVINKRYDSIQFNKMLKEMPFYKLTYKHDFKMEDKQGNITLYGYLINTYAGNSTGVS